MKDFWISCGHHLLDRDEGGGLLLTDDFLKVYMARPEMIPPPEACAVEKTLHAALLNDPRMEVSAADIAAIADADARENWQILLTFRDHLVRHKTLEAAYSDLVKQGLSRTPQLFVNQLVHVVMRNALNGIDDAAVVRAGEMFYLPAGWFHEVVSFSGAQTHCKGICVMFRVSLFVCVYNNLYSSAYVSINIYIHITFVCRG